ncbi:hypothetical protein GCM10011332_31500 [Terasakiella brassicae]|uniref:Methyltransferase type 11 domain-containing protein n=1 Tax=Terasakiella brassicae TaxID=1634917 RepID=A0A917C841_9PROT|nr:class I SAM-dependent methyltransferase [Terasakiella brassicae]GGF75176.1 hypothetical protein GCM10011332_31500 [Terasakiella brassicae]
MKDNFYKALEDHFRGSRDLIKSRLDVYMPFIEPLKEVYPNSTILDLGCGRGEWLELMNEHGFIAQGVDANVDMLLECQKHNLSVTQDDVISFLKKQQSESIALVSAFHLVEHIAFDDLLLLIEEAKRVLLPGGLLIMETPNPENIVVGSSHFYLDPTHQRPIPQLLLSFTTVYSQYYRNKVVRLQEFYDDHADKSDISLYDVLVGVSHDYSVIAQKQGTEEVLQLSDSIFNAKHGHTLKEIAMAYNEGHNMKWIKEEYQKSTEQISMLLDIQKKDKEEIKEFKYCLINNEAELQEKNNIIQVKDCLIQEKDDLINALNQSTNKYKEKIADLNKNGHIWYTQHNKVKSDLESLLNSKSWRYTLPMRKTFKLIKYVLRLPYKALYSLFVSLVYIFVRVDFLKKCALLVIKKGNPLHKRLHMIACDNMLFHEEDEIIEVKIKNTPEDIVQKTINSPNYFKSDIEKVLVKEFGYTFNLNKIIEIRGSDKPIEKLLNEEQPEEIITLLFLAYLRRHPSQQDIANHVNHIKSEKGIQSLMESIFKSNEYRVNGPKVVK